MLLQRSPGLEVFAEFTLAQCCVDLAVANFMDQLLGFTAAAFRQQVVLINAQASDHRPAAKGAVGQSERFDVAQRLSAA